MLPTEHTRGEGTMPQVQWILYHVVSAGNEKANELDNKGCHMRISQPSLIARREQAVEWPLCGMPPTQDMMIDHFKVRKKALGVRRPQDHIEALSYSDVV